MEEYTKGQIFENAKEMLAESDKNAETGLFCNQPCEGCPCYDSGDEGGCENDNYEWLENWIRDNEPKQEETPDNKQTGSILTEAESIVNGARATDYESAKESFGKIATMASLMLNKTEKESLLHDCTLTDTIVCKVLMAVKLTREANKHKRDNLVDLSGYAELLNRLEAE